MTRGIFLEDPRAMDGIERSEMIRKAMHPHANRVIDSARFDEVSRRVVDRAPCIRCGTRADIHDRFGCKNGRGL